MIANISDIAAMAGHPTKAVVSLCVPDSLTSADVSSLYDGMLEACRQYGAEVVGGDVVASARDLTISVAMMGVAKKGRVVTRAGAIVGDAVLVTGRLGSAEAGLMALKRQLDDEGLVLDAKGKHRMPAARVLEAAALLDVATPMAMIDISDGLASELWHIAEESNVGVRILSDRVPIADAAVDVAERLGVEALELALYGGEEFELVVTMPASEVERTIAHVRAVTGTEMTRIGDVVGADHGCTIVDSAGASSQLERRGYEHFGRVGALAPGDWGAEGGGRSAVRGDQADGREE
jgi:thiamine-monophosphate kinase